MKLAIHAAAGERFNEIGEQILRTITKQPRKGSSQPAFKPDIHVAAHLKEKDILGPVRVEQQILDGTGVQVGRFFDHEDHRAGIVGEPFQQLLQLVERIQSSGLRNVVSLNRLLDTAFAWIEGRYKKVIDEPLVPFLLREIEPMVRQQELWIPLHRVYLEEPVVIGQVRFETVTKAMLDERESQLRKRASPEDLSVVVHYMERDRKRFQGTAAAVISVTAEPTRADELAHERARQAVALMRFFSPANWHPEIRSYCTLLGDEDVRMETTFTVKDGALSNLSTGVQDRRSKIDWFVTPHIRQFPDLLLAISLLADERVKKTDFQAKLLDAMLLYSRNSVAREPVDKVVYIFAALESMLLKNESEPVQKNIGERMAFLIGDNISSRKEISANVIDVYSKRSLFVHHGLSITSSGTVSTFMVNAWTCFYRLIDLARTIPTKDALIERLEERKFQ